MQFLINWKLVDHTDVGHVVQKCMVAAMNH